MTFRDWYLQVAREHPDNIPIDLVKSVLLWAIRVAIEEMMANPASADLDILGLGRFYLNRRYTHVTPSDFACDEEKMLIRWSIHFKPSRQLKETLNGQRDVREFIIAHNSLYPEIVFEEDSGLRRPFKLKKTRKPKYKITITKGYYESKEREERKKLREEKKKIKEKLPDED